MALFDIRVVEILMSWLLQLKLKRNRSIVLLLLIVVLPSHLYVFQLMDLLVMRPVAFCDIRHILYLLSGIIVVVRSLAGCMLM